MTETIVLILVIVVLCALLLLREWQNYQERRELLSRIMSVDYTLFKRSERAAGLPSRPHVFPARMSEAELAHATETKAQNA